MNFFKKKGLSVVLWSYSDEGKTTLLYRGFKDIQNFKTIPTIGFNVETIDFNGIEITFWDIGGACGIKKLRNHYLPNHDIIIFLIDSSESLENDNFGLHYKLNFKELQECINLIEDKPLLIAITKIDKRKSRTFDIIDAYQLQKLFERKKKFGIIECSSFTSQGIKEILFWLSSNVK